MRKINLTKTDAFIALACTFFLLANLGSIGNGGRRRAKEAVCAANLKRWGVIFQVLAQDNDGHFMDRGDTAHWAETLWSYHKSPRLLLCPEAVRSWDQGALNPFAAWSRDDVKGSYCINLWISNEHGSGKIGGGQQEYWGSPYVAGAESVPIFGDGQWTDADPLVTDEPSQYETDFWTPNMNEMQRFCVSRHNGAINMLFLDFSLRKIGLKHLWRQSWHRTFDLEAPLPLWPAWMQNFKDP
jgi:prepilin-type processing-associated H-X9-DG protein